MPKTAFSRRWKAEARKGLVNLALDVIAAMRASNVSPVSGDLGVKYSGSRPVMGMGPVEEEAGPSGARPNEVSERSLTKALSNDGGSVARKRRNRKGRHAYIDRKFRRAARRAELGGDTESDLYRSIAFLETKYPSMTGTEGSVLGAAGIPLPVTPDEEGQARRIQEAEFLSYFFRYECLSCDGTGVWRMEFTSYADAMQRGLLCPLSDERGLRLGVRPTAWVEKSHQGPPYNTMRWVGADVPPFQVVSDNTSRRWRPLGEGSQIGQLGGFLDDVVEESAPMIGRGRSRGDGPSRFTRKGTRKGNPPPKPG